MDIIELSKWHHHALKRHQAMN
ncbi:hypothetical protein [Acinetobacter thermotolerans]